MRKTGMRKTGQVRYEHAESGWLRSASDLTARNVASEELTVLTQLEAPIFAGADRSAPARGYPRESRRAWLCLPLRLFWVPRPRLGNGFTWACESV